MASDPMGAPSSFTARRPNASNLPQFELPPPQLPAFQKYNSYQPHIAHPQPGSTSLASVGNLLTPPSGSSADGLSPTSSAGAIGATSTAPHTMAPYTPSYNWPAPSAHYNFQQPAMSPSTFNSSRPPFSPSLSTIVKNTSSPNPTNDLPHSSHSSEVQSYPMSAPVSLPSLSTQQQMAMMGQGPMSAPITQASPVHSQDAFARQPPTPTYYSGPHSATPAQTPFPYSAGPSPVQHSPVSAGPLSRMSPTHSHGQIPSIHSQMNQTHSPYAPQRPFSYPGPVMSNMNNPSNQMALVGGMPNGMVHGYNSGHAAMMYGHAGQAQGPNNDRPFKCDQCPQSFNRNHDLKRHKRIHLAVKPFPCGHCDKSFSRKDALKRHILVKGCGKVGAQNDGDKRSSDGSVSPIAKSEMADSSPVVAASA
ncbi:hypothetical protein KVT40_000825 [Elsinoe batatas]|uniref:C2H2-type domain-containing protein n=1 Tax=Elsinoe batatas TaxID=2601811 RepID=A0A8K0LAB9_9PEZI|nr:hypothetical protein KVT40_000825 [Elsinoe batatas]